MAGAQLTPQEQEQLKQSMPGVDFSKLSPMTIQTLQKLIAQKAGASQRAMGAAASPAPSSPSPSASMVPPDTPHGGKAPAGPVPIGPQAQPATPPGGESALANLPPPGAETPPPQKPATPRIAGSRAAPGQGAVPPEELRTQARGMIDVIKQKGLIDENGDLRMNVGAKELSAMGLTDREKEFFNRMRAADKKSGGRAKKARKKISGVMSGLESATKGI